jgi:hydrogenase-4 transcriptional activator
MFQALFVRELMAVEREALARFSESPNREEASRAAVILLSSEGKTAAEIGHALGAHPSNIKKWIRRFNKDGLNGIAVKKRGPQGGPRPRFSNRQIEEILTLAGKAPVNLGYDFKAWTPQKLATAAMERNIVDRISHVTVRQLLKRNGSAQHPAKSEATVSSNGSNSSKHEIDDGPYFSRGEAELAQYRYEAAAEYFYSSLTEDDLSLEDEAKIRSLLSKALVELSRYKDSFNAIGKYEDPRNLAPLSPRTRARVKLRLGWVNSFLRNYAEAIASLNESKRLFLELGDDLGVSEAQYALGRTYIEINEFRIARDHLVAAARNQKTALDRELLAQIHNYLGTIDFSEGALSSSKEHYSKALEVSRGSSNANLIGMVLLNLGTCFDAGYAMEREEGAKHLRRAIEYLEKGGHKDYLALAYNNLGENLRYAGLWAEAMENLQKAIEISRGYSKPNYEATAHVTLAEILNARGEYAEAESHLNQCLDLIGGGLDKWLESNALRVLASVQQGQARYEKALRTLRQSLQLSTSIGDLYGVMIAQLYLAELHFIQGGSDQAREYLELTQGRLKDELDLPVSGTVQRLTGQLEAASGRLAEARQHIGQSISIFTTADIHYDLARSYYEMGVLLKKGRDLKVAESNLLQAEALFERLGAGPDLELTRKALSSISDGNEGPQVLRATALNDVLLMQRLIEASASRDLLLQELAAVIYENFSVKAVIISRIEDGGRLEPVVTQGIARAEAERLCLTLEISRAESPTRSHEGYSLRIGDNTRNPLAVFIRSDQVLDAGRLHPLLKQAELGLETCSLRAAARGSAAANLEQRVQTIMPGFIIGSAPMFDVIDKIFKIRTSDVTVLITGESGTGKELVARHIHGQSARARAIFLPFNCTATPKEIIDSQLFGHRRGAFTGATANYPGIIKAADGGTLFLDEIGDLALEVQPKLMRFLQEGEIQPLGETKPLRVDVRILAATNSDLERAVEDGRFREDLFHRLNIIRIHVPPLRDRREEVPVLAAHFLEHFSSRSGKQGISMTQDAIDALMNYDWPGNVRQLRNEIERMVAYAYDSSRISVEDLSPEVVHPRRQLSAERMRAGAERAFASAGESRFNAGANGGGVKKRAEGETRVKLKEATATLERQLIEESLARNRNNLSRTAIDLGLSRRGLRLKLIQLGIHREER